MCPTPRSGMGGRCAAGPNVFRKRNRLRRLANCAGLNASRVVRSPNGDPLSVILSPRPTNPSGRGALFVLRDRLTCGPEPAAASSVDQLPPLHGRCRPSIMSTGIATWDGRPRARRGALPSQPHQEGPGPRCRPPRRGGGSPRRSPVAPRPWWFPAECARGRRALASRDRCGRPFPARRTGWAP